MVKLLNCVIRSFFLINVSPSFPSIHCKLYMFKWAYVCVCADVSAEFSALELKSIWIAMKLIFAVRLVKEYYFYLVVQYASKSSFALESQNIWKKDEQLCRERTAKTTETETLRRSDSNWDSYHKQNEHFHILNVYIKTERCKHRH